MHMKHALLWGRGVTKNQYRGWCLKRGTLTVCKFKRVGGGVLGKKEDIGVFEECLIPQCTLWTSVNGWINFCMNLQHWRKDTFFKEG